MSHPRRGPFVLVIGVVLALPVLAQDKTQQGTMQQKSAPANPAFEKLKALAGQWVIVGEPVHKEAGQSPAKSGETSEGAKAAPDQSAQGDKPSPAAAGAQGSPVAGKPTENVPACPAGQQATDAGARKPDDEPAIIYTVIAAGSAVHEHMFPGGPHEMVTMYHLDGPELLLTHYCAAGNQPRMKAEKSADPNRLVFKFAGGTNLDPAKDMHMHDLTITFIDADHIRQEWTHYQDGKPTGTVTFELKRKKS